VKFLVDAKLPFKLAQLLISKNYDVIHTDNLPNKEFTSDNELRIISLNPDYALEILLQRKTPSKYEVNNFFSCIIYSI
jgi:predicted nuclease of predicted toxin-antitoxin system